MSNKQLKRYKNLVSKLRWSPEIEVCFSKKVDIDKIYDQYQKLFSGWTVSYDASLEPHGLEFKPKDSNKLYFDSDSFDQIKDILSIIRGRRGFINHTCGGHIHIDMSKFSDEEVLKIIKEFVSRQKYICEDFLVSKERLGEMCKLIRKKDIKGLTIEHIRKLRKIADDEFMDTDIPILNERYYTLNITSLTYCHTLEFRFPEGHKTVREIKKRVKFLFDLILSALERE